MKVARRVRRSHRAVGTGGGTSGTPIRSPLPIPCLGVGSGFTDGLYATSGPSLPMFALAALEIRRDAPVHDAGADQKTVLESGASMRGRDHDRKYGHRMVRRQFRRGAFGGVLAGVDPLMGPGCRGAARRLVLRLGVSRRLGRVLESAPAMVRQDVAARAAVSFVDVSGATVPKLLSSVQFPGPRSRGLGVRPPPATQSAPCASHAGILADLVRW